MLQTIFDNLISGSGILITIAAFIIGLKTDLKKDKSDGEKTAYEKGIADANISNSITNLSRDISFIKENMVSKEEFLTLKFEVQSIKEGNTLTNTHKNEKDS